VSITVRDLVGQPHLRLEVLAGQAGLDRTVTWAHSSDLPDPWDWLAGGELLMKNGRTLPRPAAAQARLLETLASAGVSALVIGTDPSTPPITAQTLAVADKLGFPLMRVPYSVSFIVVSRAVADASLREESTRLVRAERIYAAIHAAAAGADPAAFLAQLSREVDCRLWVLDAGTGTSVLDGVPQPEESLRAALLDALSQRGGAVPGVLRLPGGVAVEIPYEEPTLLVAQPRDGGRADLGLLPHAATAAAVEVAHAALRHGHQRQLSAALFAQLLESRLEAATAQQQLAGHGIDPAGAQLLATRGADEDSQRRLHIGLRRRCIGHLLLSRGPVFLAIVSGPDGPGPSVALVKDRLGASAAVGVSNVLGTPLRVPDAAREAMWALGVAARRPSRIAHYGEATPLPALRDPAEAQALVDRTLGALLEYDRGSGGELVRSLAVFLACRRSWQATARELSVHRQTVVYRMRRVAMLTGRKLTETADIAELWLAVSALELLTGESLVPPRAAGHH
jgi:PucR family transcriptional regulator, purine catabolism regulatory protein